MNRKNKIRLSESDLHRIVRMSVNKVLNESALDSIDQYVYNDFIDFFVEYYSKGNGNLARNIEDYVSRKIVEMVRELDAKFGV